MLRRALLLAAIFAVCVPAAPAGAHAALVGIDPENGATVETLPDTVSLEFNEPVTRSQIVLTAPDGSAVPAEVTARDRTVVATVAPDAVAQQQRGTYTIAYRVVSADGHPVAGSSTFQTSTGKTVEAAPAPASQQESFLHRHAEHLWWAAGVALVALLLIVWPLLRRNRDE